MKKQALLGGSFDPIHNGHLSLAVDMMEKWQVEILFCPAFCSPHKKQQPPVAAAQDRLAMVELAIAPFPHFSLLTLEIERQKPSYTVETLAELTKSQQELFFIMAKEHIYSFADWKDPLAILKLASPLIGYNGEEQAVLEQIPVKWHHLFKKGLTKTRRIDVSSTELRNRLKKQHPIEHLVPAKVVDYIKNKQLYL